MNRTANPTADANRLMQDSMKRQDEQKQFDLMNVQRQKAMTSDAEKLILLARALKTETDKGTPDQGAILSIRKAELIEKLAHAIQDKMTATPNN